MEHEISNIDLEAVASDAQLAPVHDYWHSIRRARLMPLLTDMDMMALPLKVVPWCSICDVTSGARDFSIRFWGTERVGMHGIDYTGRSVSEFRLPVVRDKMLTAYAAVVETSQPVLFKISLATDLDTEIQRTHYKMLYLPFGQDDTVSAILSVPSFADNRKLVYDWFEAEVPIAVLTSQTPV
jgi:hypothetical protein